jgi:hypothetical protein
LEEAEGPKNATIFKGQVHHPKGYEWTNLPEKHIVALVQLGGLHMFAALISPQNSSIRY